MNRACLLASAILILVATGCGGSSPASPSRAAAGSLTDTVSVLSAPALFGASAVDFARCLQAVRDPGCFAGARIESRAVGSVATAPGAPANLSVSSSGNTVTLTWSAPASGDPVTTYMIEAGSAGGLANLANFPTNSTGTTFSAGGVAAGTYYVRVRAQNTGGLSGASNEATLIVGEAGCTTAPNAPGGLTSSVSGSTVVLTWNASAGGCAPSSYVLQAGSSAGLNNLANAAVGGVTSYVAPGVGAGTYYVRVRAANASGQSAGSNEVVVIVTAGPLPPVSGSIAGTWIGLAPDGMITFDSDEGCGRDVNDFQLVFTQTGSNIAGTVTWRIRESFYPPDVGRIDTHPFTGTVNGNAVSFTVVGQDPQRPTGLHVLVGSATFTSTRITGTLLDQGGTSSCPPNTFAANRQ